MATQDTAAGDSVEVRIQRPTREHAVALAQERFVRGERVDMVSLAEDLDIGRTTLYRWVGDRDQLLGEVLARLTRYTGRRVTQEATGAGLERALDTIRRFMTESSEFQPLAEFARREPEAALRILLAEHSAVTRALREFFRRTLDDNLPPPAVDDELVEVITQLGTAMEWSPIIIGEPPAIDRAIRLMRSLLVESGRRRPT